MKREDLKAMGLTDEQVDKVMAENGADINAAKATAKTDTTELLRLKNVETEFNNLKDKSLTDEQKLEKAMKDAADAKTKYQKDSNRIQAEKVFIAIGLKDEDYKGLIDMIVTDNLETTIASANSIANLVKTQKEATEKATREKGMAGTPPPAGSGGGGTSLSDAEKVAQKLAKDASLLNKNVMDGLKNLTDGGI